VSALLAAASSAVIAAALAAPLGAQPPHQHPPAGQYGGPIDTTRIAAMSPAVAQQRLRLLGYTDVTVVENARSAVRANALKGGRALTVRLDPYSGRVLEVPGKLERTPQGVRLVRPDGAVVAPPQ
jgi:hypothetical protein